MLACARHTLTFSRNIIVLPRPLGSFNFLSSKIQLECLCLFSVRFREFQFFNLVSSNKLFFASYMSRTRLCFSQREFCSLLMQLGNKQRNMFHPHVCAAAQRRCVFREKKDDRHMWRNKVWQLSWNWSFSSRSSDVDSLIKMTQWDGEREASKQHLYAMRLKVLGWRVHFLFYIVESVNWA